MLQIFILSKRNGWYKIFLPNLFMLLFLGIEPALTLGCDTEEVAQSAKDVVV